jgi:hypothetical protein
VAEAMGAGVIVVASPAGSLPELIEHGANGLLVPGDHENPEVQEAAARLILDILQRPGLVARLRRNARQWPLTWTQVARVWEEYWDWALSVRPCPSLAIGAPWAGACPGCGGDLLPLSDGYHCLKNGCYRRGLATERQ